jgi:hypothetical protein
MTGQPPAELAQDHLVAAIRLIAARLKHGIGNHREGDGHAADSIAMPHTIERIANTFGLSGFEAQALLLCAGVELDGELATAVAAASDHHRPLPTFALALSILPGAHWTALMPDRPLRRWRLLEVLPGDLLVHSPLRIDERILHEIVGVTSPDERLKGCLEAVTVPPLPDGRIDDAARLARALDDGRTVAIVPPGPLTLAFVAETARQMGRRLFRMSLGALRASSSSERDLLLLLAAREARLSRLAIVLTDDMEADALPSAVANDLVDCPLFVVTPFAPSGVARPMLVTQVSPLTAAEEGMLWSDALGSSIDTTSLLPRLRSQFRVDPNVIRDVAIEVRGLPLEQDRSVALWDGVRRRLRVSVDGLAAVLEPVATWDDLVLPEEPTALLRELVTHAKQRSIVHEQWGFHRSTTRGSGITALFVGPSGTGKTLAAEVLARELRLEMLRIDLSRVVSKYIGETEKHLRRLFDTAESGAAVLVFDEADALFGKRTETRDAHDRYANIEVSYLLQRIEHYRGIAILTTNHRESLDTAFCRRLRFVVKFPFPDVDQRRSLWSRVFPKAVPTEGLDVDRLARLEATGANIHNMALHAAFMAADERRPIGMRHMLRAARVEYAKMDRVVPPEHTRGWT